MACAVRMHNVYITLSAASHKQSAERQNPCV